MKLMLFRRVLALCLAASVLTSCVSSEIEIPHVFYINMDRSQDRRQHMETFLPTLGLQPHQWTRVNAIDSEHLNVVWPIEISTAYATAIYKDPSCMNFQAWRLGGIGRIATFASGLSHGKSIALAYARGLQEALILEDDTAAVGLGDGGAPVLWSYLRSMIDSLPQDYNVLQATRLHSSEGAQDAVSKLLDMEHILWSDRHLCTGNDFATVGAQAYVISRHGMVLFLKTHFPSLLYATVEEVESFCGYFDLRQSATCIVPDTFIYTAPGVYMSHLPLFTSAEIGNIGTVWLKPNDDKSSDDPNSKDDGAITPHFVTSATQRSIEKLKFDGIIRPEGGGWGLDAALIFTKRAHEAIVEERRRRPRARYVLFADLDLDEMHQGYHGADVTGIDMVEVTTPTQRQLVTNTIQANSNIWTARLWDRLLHIYFSNCPAHVSIQSTDNICKNDNVIQDSKVYEVILLIPMEHQLRGIYIHKPVNNLVYEFCTTVRYGIDDAGCTATMNVLANRALARIKEWDSTDVNSIKENH